MPSSWPCGVACESPPTIETRRLIMAGPSTLTLEVDDVSDTFYINLKTHIYIYTYIHTYIYIYIYYICT